MSMGMSRVDEGAFVVKLPVDSPGLALLPFEAAGTAVDCDRVSDTPGVSVVVVRIVVCAALPDKLGGEKLHGLSSVMFTFEMSPPKKLIIKGLKKHSRVNS